MAKSGESPWVEQLDEDRIVYEAAAVLKDTETLIEEERIGRMLLNRDNQVLEAASAEEHQRQVWRNIGVVGLVCIGAVFSVTLHHYKKRGA